MTSNIPEPRTSPETDRETETETIADRIVVGVDGSSASVRALLWALGFAATSGATVDVLTAWPVNAPVFVGEVPGHFNDARWQAVQAQRLAVERAAALLGTPAEVVVRIENARPLEALRAAAETATLVVLGARDGDVRVRRAGTSLAEALQVAVHCPVLEVSALGVVSVPWGRYAFRDAPARRDLTRRRATGSATTPAPAGLRRSPSR